MPHHVNRAEEWEEVISFCENQTGKPIHEIAGGMHQVLSSSLSSLPIPLPNQGSYLTYHEPVLRPFPGVKRPVSSCFYPSLGKIV